MSATVATFIFLLSTIVGLVHITYSQEGRAVLTAILAATLGLAILVAVKVRFKALTKGSLSVVMTGTITFTLWLLIIWAVALFLAATLGLSISDGEKVNIMSD